jgi:hypothetical protein
MQKLLIDAGVFAGTEAAASGAFANPLKKASQ